MSLIERLPISYINSIFIQIPTQFFKVYYFNKLFCFTSPRVTITATNLIINFFHEYLYIIFFIFKKHFNFRYQQLTDIACIDLLAPNKRFVLYYYLLSFLNADRITLALDLHELGSPYSVTPLYKGAN